MPTSFCRPDSDRLHRSGHRYLGRGVGLAQHQQSLWPGTRPGAGAAETDRTGRCRDRECDPAGRAAPAHLPARQAFALVDDVRLCQHLLRVAHDSGAVCGVHSESPQSTSSPCRSSRSACCAWSPRCTTPFATSRFPWELWSWRSTACARTPTARRHPPPFASRCAAPSPCDCVAITMLDKFRRQMAGICHHESVKQEGKARPVLGRVLRIPEHRDKRADDRHSSTVRSEPT